MKKFKCIRSISHPGVYDGETKYEIYADENGKEYYRLMGSDKVLVENAGENKLRQGWVIDPSDKNCRVFDSPV